MDKLIFEFFRSSKTSELRKFKIKRPIETNKKYNMGDVITSMKQNTSHLTNLRQLTLSQM